MHRWIRAVCKCVYTFGTAFCFNWMWHWSTACAILVNSAIFISFTNERKLQCLRAPFIVCLCMCRCAMVKRRRIFRHQHRFACSLTFWNWREECSVQRDAVSTCHFPLESHFFPTYVHLFITAWLIKYPCIQKIWREIELCKAKWENSAAKVVYTAYRLRRNRYL